MPPQLEQGGNRLLVTKLTVNENEGLQDTEKKLESDFVWCIRPSSCVCAYSLV